MKTFLIIWLCLCLSGCYCNFKLSDSKFHSSNKIIYGFEISKITVDSFTVDEIPLKFSRDSTITCDPYCYEYASEMEFKAIHGQDATYIDTCNFKPSKTIYFNKPNSDYKWSFFVPYAPETSYDILPITFRKGNWYEIKNYCDPYHYVYFYIEANGELLIKKITKW